MGRITVALSCLLAAASLTAHAQSKSQVETARGVGGMAYPAPTPGSGITREAVPIPETGGMREPNFPTGTAQTRRAPTGRDVGSMQYPSAK